MREVASCWVPSTGLAQGGSLACAAALGPRAPAAGAIACLIMRLPVPHLRDRAFPISRARRDAASGAPAIRSGPRGCSELVP